MKPKSFIVYFLTQSLFLGYGISLLYSISGKDSYLGAIVGLIIGFGIIYLYSRFLEIKQKQNLKELLNKNKVLGWILRIILIIAIFTLLIYALVIYKVFVASFLLIKTPEIFIVVPIIIFGTYGAFKGLELISRVAESLIPIAIFLGLFAALGVGGLFDISNFMPILTTTPSNFLKTAFTFASLTTFPNLLLIFYPERPKHLIKTYLISALIIILTMIYINGILGEQLVHIYRFPEYMVLKQLKLFSFVEKVENILAIPWIFNIFMLIMTSIYALKELIPSKHNKKIMIPILIITIIIISKVFAQNYVNELRIYHYIPYVSTIFILIILPLIMYLVHKKN